MSAEDELHNLVDEWHQNADKAQNCHYEAGLFYERLFLALGIPVIVLSALTGGSEILGTIGQHVGGVISLCIAVIAGLQTFLKFSQRSERHRVAGARYGGMKRSLEEAKITLSESGEGAKAEIHEIKKQLDALANECPELPSRISRRYDLNVVKK